MRIAAVIPTSSQLESWPAWLALAFQRLHHDVRAFPYRDVAAGGGPERMNARLLRAVRKWDSEIVLVVKGELIEPGTLEAIKKDGFVTVLLANDDHQVLESVSIPLGRHCDRVFTFTKGAIPRYRQEGVAAEHVLFYADPLVCAPKESPKEYDVSFVGTYYPEREGIVKAFRKAAEAGELTFRLIGDGWDRASDRAVSAGAFSYGGRADYAEVLRTWQSSRICLNIHQAGLAKMGVVANLRCYELGAAHCPMLTDVPDRADMTGAFQGPLPFGTYDAYNAESALDAARAALRLPERDLELTAGRMREIVLAKHAPQNRAQQILTSLKLYAGEIPA